jgi:hypothetical protein
MPICFRCQADTEQVICMPCHERVIVDLTELLEEIQQKLLSATAKAQFLQGLVRPTAAKPKDGRCLMPLDVTLEPLNASTRMLSLSMTRSL